MASKISPTPILRGKDSENFNKSLAEGLKKKILKKEIEEMKELVKAVLKNATFPV